MRIKKIYPTCVQPWDSKLTEPSNGPYRERPGRSFPLRRLRPFGGLRVAGAPAPQLHFVSECHVSGTERLRNVAASQDADLHAGVLPRRTLRRAMKVRVGKRGSSVERASVAEEPKRLHPVAVPTDRLEVRVFEGGSARRDLHDVIDFQLAGPASAVADLAGVAVAQHHVRAGRVPEVVPVETPLARAGAVRASVVFEGLSALDAPTRASGLGAPADAVGEPRRRERHDSAVRSDDHRCGGFRRGHPIGRRRGGFNRIPLQRKSAPPRTVPGRVFRARPPPRYGLFPRSYGVRA